MPPEPLCQACLSPNPMVAKSVLKAAQTDQFFGWWVVGGCFVMATACWGLAFYGNGLYLAHLVRERGWPVDQVSPAFTVFYWLGAVSIIATGRWVDHVGPRASAMLGMVVMGLGVIQVARVTELWHLYAALALMALGWSWMSGAAINSTIARWFDRQRGTALSIALTGASMGGILVVPLMVAAIDRFGFSAGITYLVLVLGSVVLITVALTFVREPQQLGQWPDGERPVHVAIGQPINDAGLVVGWPLTRLIRMRAFLTNVAPFALGLMAQVGFLTHQVSLIEERHSRTAAAWAVMATTGSAILGRLIGGYFADRYSRRLIAAMNFAVQVLGLLLIALTDSIWAIYLGSALFGLAVGNLIAFSGLLVQREFPREQFAHVTRWATAVTQAVYALGPALVGVLRQASGSYQACLWVCAAINLLACLIVWFGRPRQAA